MRTLAIVPIKSFDIAKQRLAGVLQRGAREALAQAMVSDVLAALRHVRAIDGVVVVTADPRAESVARQSATVLNDLGRAGQSAAAEIGIRHALAAGFERVLLVPGDTPLVEPDEIERLLHATAADGIAVGIVGDRHGTGTNALVLAPPDAIATSFGPGSLARHVAAAEAAGAPHRVEHAPSLAHDVDTPEDLTLMSQTLDGRRGGAQRTRGALRQLERSGALDALRRADGPVAQG